MRARMRAHTCMPHARMSIQACMCAYVHTMCVCDVVWTILYNDVCRLPSIYSFISLPDWSDKFDVFMVSVVRCCSKNSLQHFKLHLLKIIMWTRTWKSDVSVKITYLIFHHYRLILLRQLGVRKDAQSWLSWKCFCYFTTHQRCTYPS